MNGITISKSDRYINNQSSRDTSVKVTESWNSDYCFSKKPRKYILFFKLPSENAGQFDKTIFPRYLDKRYTQYDFIRNAFIRNRPQMFEQFSRKKGIF